MNRTLLLDVLLALLLAPGATAQTTWYVDVANTPPGSGSVADPYSSLDYALAQPTTVSGDTVLVAPGTYFENVTFPGRGVTVTATGGAAATTIDAGGAGSAVRMLGTDGTTMTLDGFTLTNGSGTSPTMSSGDEQGGGLLALDCIARIRRCTVENNVADQGGGVYAGNSDFDMRACTVRDNQAPNGNSTGGGLMFSGGTNKLRRCVIQFNEAGFGSNPGWGGGIYATAHLSLRRCSVADNHADFGGGGVFGSTEIWGCRIVRNYGQFGGGVNGTPMILRSTFRENRADSNAGGFGHWGGGVYGAATVEQCLFDSNVAVGKGGAAYGATMNDCTIVDNSANDSEAPAAQGGGVASCTLTNCTLRRNTVTATGFGSEGGGAFQSTLDGCLLDANDSTCSTAWNAKGGGAFECVLTDCLVVDNTTNGYGGGVFRGSTLSTELVGNQANWGGGAANASLNRTTAYGNTATTAGGGVFVDGFSAGSVLDSILWQNGASEIGVEAGGVLGVTYSDVLGGWAGTGNIALDPVFWNPASPDLHLQATSPCIDAGNPASPLDPDGTRADMGAHPYDPMYSG